MVAKLACFREVPCCTDGNPLARKASMPDKTVTRRIQNNKIYTTPTYKYAHNQTHEPTYINLRKGSASAETVLKC